MMSATVYIIYIAWFLTLYKSDKDMVLKELFVEDLNIELATKNINIFIRKDK